MKTTLYNPSNIELEFANAIKGLIPEIEEKLSTNKILDVKTTIDVDNPFLVFSLEDGDGDKHELVLKLIQRPDKE